MTVTLADLSEDALHEICRSLADRGEDYGWNVYYKGTVIPAHEERRLRAQDENIGGWLEAFRATTALYEARFGEPWRY